MFSQQDCNALLLAKVGDSLDTEAVKGKVVEIQFMRDSLGNPAYVVIIQPEGGKASKQSEFVLQTGAVSSSIAVEAELLYASGDRGRLMRWTAEYTLEAGDKKTEGGLFFLHGGALEENTDRLMMWLGRGGTIFPAKMAKAKEKELHEYLIKTQPAMKAVSIDDMREFCARNAWPISDGRDA